MNRIRVLELITDLEPGGAPFVVRDLALGLARWDEGRAFHVEVACLAGDGPVGRELAAAGIRVHSLGARGPWDVRVFRRLARLLRQVRPDVLHCHLVHANVAGKVAGRLCGVRRIVTSVHTAEIHKRWHLTLESLTKPLCDVTVAVSPSVARHLELHVHIPASRLCTILNGIDLGRFSPRTAWAESPSYEESGVDVSSLGLDADMPRLLFVGRLDPVKRVDVLLRAAAMLRDERHRPCNLLVAGDGEARAQWQGLASQLKLDGLVRFLGRREDIANLLHAADVFVLPSDVEGMPLAACEAMAAGCPVVASDIAALADIVAHEKTGLLFPAGDSVSLAAAVARVLDDSSLAQRLAAAAREHAQEHFSREAMIAAHADVYMHLLAMG